MKTVLLTGAAIAVVGGIVVGVSLGVGEGGVALTAFVLGLLAAGVLAWLTPDAPAVERQTVTLGVPVEAASAVEDETAEVGSAPVAAPVAAPTPVAVSAPVAAPTPVAVSGRPDRTPALTALPA